MRRAAAAEKGKDRGGDVEPLLGIVGRKTRGRRASTQAEAEDAERAAAARREEAVSAALRPHAPAAKKAPPVVDETKPAPVKFVKSKKRAADETTRQRNKRKEGPVSGQVHSRRPGLPQLLGGGCRVLQARGGGRAFARVVLASRRQPLERADAGEERPQRPAHHGTAKRPSRASGRVLRRKRRSAACAANIKLTHAAPMAAQSYLPNSRPASTRTHVRRYAHALKWAPSRLVARNDGIETPKPGRSASARSARSVYSPPRRTRSGGSNARQFLADGRKPRRADQ